MSWLVKDYEFVRMNPTIGAVYEAKLEKVGIVRSVGTDRAATK
ncbi:MAG TPA: hypothetical protein VJ010_10455 [Actinomycetota bacterium]|nr:hypothetical protein [Actinomycetota bacterium]